MGGFLTIEQRILAGSDFDGTTPDGSRSYDAGLEQFEAGTHGGRFEFEIRQPHMVRTIELGLGGQSAWTVHKLDLDGREFMIAQGDDEDHVLLTERDSFVLHRGQVLLVRTTGATGDLVARVSIQNPE